MAPASGGFNVTSVVAGQRKEYYFATNQEEKRHPLPPSPPMVKVLRIAHQSLHRHCLQSKSKDSSCQVSVCVLETCFLGLLFLDLLFVPLSSPGACPVAAPAPPLLSVDFEVVLPLQWEVEEEVPHLLETTPRPVCKPAPV